MSAQTKTRKEKVLLFLNVERQAFILKETAEVDQFMKPMTKGYLLWPPEWTLSL
jgi:hypothetical protein